MAITQAARHPFLTERDELLLRALARCPLTCQQLLQLSRTFPQPFPSIGRLRVRLRMLASRRRLIPPLIRQWEYATTAYNPLTYYTLTRLGCQAFFGPEEPVRDAYTRPVAFARQPHTQALADFIVHTQIAAHAAGVSVMNTARENTLRLDVGAECLYPDDTFELQTADAAAFRFFTELDNGTEPVVSAKDRDNWERKLRLYLAHAIRTGTQFRVLVVSTNRGERLEHILALAAAVIGQRRRSLCCGIRLPAYLAEEQAVTAPCFRDNRGEMVALLPHYHRERRARAARSCADRSGHVARSGEELISAPPVGLNRAPFGLPEANLAKNCTVRFVQDWRRAHADMLSLFWQATLSSQPCGTVRRSLW